jgi:hypothetical protein
LQKGGESVANCGICKRELDQPADPLSNDCAGDCWGCISEIEADMIGVSVDEYRKHPAKYLPDPNESIPQRI